MKLQDYFPYQPTSFINTIFHPINDDSFYIKSPSIRSDGQVVKVGQTYMMIGKPLECSAELRAVILMDVFYKDSFVNLVILDIKTQDASTISIPIDTDFQIGEWQLLDLKYFIDNVLNEYAQNR